MRRASATSQIAKVKKLARDADKLLSGGSKRERAAAQTILKAAKREQARLELAISKSDKDVMAAFRQANADAPAKLRVVDQASPASSSSEGLSGGAFQASATLTPDGRTQDLPSQRSVNARPDAGSSTKRATTPSTLKGRPSTRPEPVAGSVVNDKPSRPILRDVHPLFRPVHDEAMRLFQGEKKSTVVQRTMFQEPAPRLPRRRDWACSPLRAGAKGGNRRRSHQCFHARPRGGYTCRRQLLAGSQTGLDIFRPADDAIIRCFLIRFRAIYGTRGGDSFQLRYRDGISSISRRNPGHRDCRR